MLNPVVTEKGSRNVNECRWTRILVLYPSVDEGRMGVLYAGRDRMRFWRFLSG